ncbi:DUF4301 family protein [Bacteroidota bacterium]
MFSKNDLQQIKKKGIPPNTINNQLSRYKNGIQYLTIIKPATTSSGIYTLNQEKRENAIEEFEKQSVKLNITKFVPASGAATRMFAPLIDFRKNYEESPEKLLHLLVDRDFNSSYYFFENLRKFAFIDILIRRIHKKGDSFDSLINEKRYGRILSVLLGKKGMNYAYLPKGLIKFHKYKDYSRTATEEHMAEAAGYCVGKNNQINIHFTVSKEYKDLFLEHIEDKHSRFAEKFNVKYNFSVSEQDSSTDIIAVDNKNKPARDENGNLIFLPGGHGALIHNLNKIDSDIIFIKNIDNVVPDVYKDETFIYKKAIAGILIQIQEKLFKYLIEIEEIDILDIKYLKKLLNFLKSELCIQPPEDIEEWSDIKKLNYVTAKLNRPIRVCGMVEIEDEPGGGPFMAKNSDGSHSLQIVENSQINLNDECQKKIYDRSTHFNPVDLVCGVRDYKGNKFDLTKFSDPEAGFISNKTKNGKEIKIQELPGLWNGGMSNWTTIFVEVPLATFAPVKIVNDLLRTEHQILY